MLVAIVFFTCQPDPSVYLLYYGLPDLLLLKLYLIIICSPLLRVFSLFYFRFSSINPIFSPPNPPLCYCHLPVALLCFPICFPPRYTLSFMFQSLNFMSFLFPSALPHFLPLTLAVSLPLPFQFSIFSLFPASLPKSTYSPLLSTYLGCVLLNIF